MMFGINKRTVWEKQTPCLSFFYYNKHSVCKLDTMFGYQTLFGV